MNPKLLDIELMLTKKPCEGFDAKIVQVLQIYSEPNPALSDLFELTGVGQCQQQPSVLNQHLRDLTAESPRILQVLNDLKGTHNVGVFTRFQSRSGWNA